MVSVNDASGMGKKLERQWKKLENADIDDRDRNAIGAFIDYRRERENRARSTRRTDLSVLRNASERAAVSLVDMGDSDVTDLFGLLAAPKDDGGYGLARDGSGMFDYARALRVFFKWADRTDDRPDYPFWENIDTPTRNVEGPVTSDDILTPEEVEQLKDAAKYPRDRTFIDFLADVGTRISLLLGLRVGDVRGLDGDEPFFVPNEGVEDGHKQIEDGRELPVLNCRAELRSWINIHHPDPENPDAPLWPVLRGYDPDNPEGNALGDDRVRKILRECADRAGIEKPVNPHHFRRVALTRMANSDRLEDRQIRDIAGWADTRMLDVYDYTTDRERNASIHAALGFSDGEDGEGETVTEAFTQTRCNNCRESLSGQRFCPNCGEPTDPDARRVREATETVRGETAAVALGEDLSADEREGLQALLALVDDPATLAAKLAGADTDG